MSTAPEAERAAERQALLAEVEAEVRGTAAWTGVRGLSPEVRGALLRVPRHRFVPEADAARAYANVPLPIGSGQTISQPYIVAIMTELARVAGADAVLEVGTGCGYQTAVLAELARRVYSIELLPELAESAAARLAALGYSNLALRCADGSRGWPEHAPFDAIVVTAAAAAPPDALVEQLGPAGRMLIPIGGRGGEQALALLERSASGRVERRDLLPVAFVPLRGEA